ncbi:glycosyl transferase family 2 [Halobacteriales archaeon QS_3_64_16]|nr:MAG: glycosyl transferase family 2 [Halobacteriales archaeon QS_3_64_16]
MDFAQDRVTTLHALAEPDRIPNAPTARTTVLVPMAAADAGPGSDRVFSALETLDIERVVVALRAPADRVPSIEKRLASRSIPIELLWCNGPRIEGLLRAQDLDGPSGKGRDVWLGLGLAAESQYVAIHDADTASYTEAYVPRLVAPLGTGSERSERSENGDVNEDDGEGGNENRNERGTNGYRFTKGYYARIEGDRLYGRLCRLLYAPLVRTLAESHDASILPYLEAFRYGLAGECAMTGDLAREVRCRRGWGLEVGLLGEVFGVAGSEWVAQVDLGAHDHEHRSVDGVAGLSAMAESVADALLQTVEDRGVQPAYASLPERYREQAMAFVDSYHADAAFNGLAYDATGERRQVRAYADAITPPETDDRLPAWEDAPIAAESVRAAARADLEAIAEGSAIQGAYR